MLRLKGYVQEHRGLVVQNILVAVAAISSYYFGRYCADNTDHVFGTGSWKSPAFLGNSGRSPIYPYTKRPFITDVEERIVYEQK